jgi:sugar phosphate isomerase/epimerase
MKTSQIAVTLYTVRNFCQTAYDLAESLKKIRGIGYQTIQIAGIGEVPAEQVAQIAADHDLRICATHEQAQTILEQPEKIVEKLEILNCPLTAYAYPVGVDFSDPGAVTTLADSLEKSASVLQSAGFTLAYHNHSLELAKQNGRVILDHLLALAPTLAFELDTYWIQHGGGDPVDYVRQYAGRIPALHCKDYVIRDGRPDYAEIGNGNLNFPKIIDEAEKGGTDWFIVEQDTTPGDPFDSLRQSFAYLAGAFVR